MRPTLSEMGEYDGTALMERKTRKNIVYRIKNETACTYEFDDTPPFSVNREALGQAIEIALLLKTNIVGELHITRKQYLDGSIPTGFQRTAIVGIEGEIPLSNKTVRMIQISLEEDACREVSDVGHWRVYRTDRLGMPLIESVTYPDMLTPDEAAEAGNYLRFLTRSSGKVRTGIGAARQDVNVSITGGTRVEIKGVAHIKWIPELTHNEAFRQKALLKIKEVLSRVVSDPGSWRLSVKDLDYEQLGAECIPMRQACSEGARLVAVNLPGFRSVLSFFTQPGKMFADELSDRLKVIACLEKPNMLHSEQLKPCLTPQDMEMVVSLTGASENDAQVIVWGDSEDVDTAIETIEERCLMAFDGVPNETRKSLPDGTTIFERVLPGPDRMYPDTDSAPIPIPEDLIEDARRRMPVDVSERLRQLREWEVPADCTPYLLRRNLIPLVERIAGATQYSPGFVCRLFGHTLKHLEPKTDGWTEVRIERLFGLFTFADAGNLNSELVKVLLTGFMTHPHEEFDVILRNTGYAPRSREDILESIPGLAGEFVYNGNGDHARARERWMMGQLRIRALGNMPLSELFQHVRKEVAHG